MPVADIAVATAIAPASISTLKANATAAPVSIPSVMTMCGAQPGSPHKTDRPAVLPSPRIFADFLGYGDRPSGPTPSSALPTPPA